MPGDALLIQDYLESWLATEKDNIKHSTLVGYRKILKYHLVPVFGKMLLTELRRKHLRDWAASHPDMSAKRMRNVLSPLRVALDAAVERELIESNPLIGFKVRKRSGGKTVDVDPFSADERSALLSSPDSPPNTILTLTL